jgi:hypothetical protein
MIAGSASKELPFVIKIIIAVRAAPRQRRPPFAIRTKWSLVRAKAARRQSLIWHVSSPDPRMNESLEICRLVDGHNSGSRGLGRFGFLAPLPFSQNATLAI